MAPLLLFRANQILIEGLAFENGDVNNFNRNLNQKSLIKLATVDGTTSATLEQTKSTSMKRAFKIKITLGGFYFSYI